MIANTIFAAGAFASLVAAIPMAQVQHQKRDIVWETQTEVAITTIPVTVTHWLEPGESAPTDAPVGKQHYGHGGHGHGHGHGGYGQPAPQPAPQPTTSEAPAPVAPAFTAEDTQAPAPSSYEQPTSQAPPPPPAYTAPAPAPEPSTEAAPAPEPTTTWEAPSPPAYTPPAPAPEPQTSAAPAPEPSSPSYGGSAPSDGLTGMAAAGQSYTGDITHWTPALGACGWTNNDSEAVVAIGESLFDQYTPTTGIHAGNPNDNALCGKYVSITGTDGSKTRAKIVDRCGGCDASSLDLSPSLFTTVAPKGDGRVHGVEWMFE